MDADLTNSDTSAEAERVLVEKLRAMSPGQRLGLALSLSRSVRALALAGIRQRYPEATDREQFLRFSVAIHGRELATAAYPEIATLDLS
jgi:hypothetical protein